jgi:CRP/FNR family transcriptional regulator
VQLSVSGTWSALPEAVASELFANGPSRCLKAGHTLFQAGDAGDGCYRLDIGLLKVSLIIATDQGADNFDTSSGCDRG